MSEYTIINDYPRLIIFITSNSSCKTCEHCLFVNIPTFTDYLDKHELKKKVPNCFVIFRCALTWSRQKTWKCANSGCLLHTSLDRNGCSKLASNIWKQLNTETKNLFKELYKQLVAFNTTLPNTNTEYSLNTAPNLLNYFDNFWGYY
ncbi:7446_t:CDS:1 [Ambispora leptoticha]|uniref:7446_t:CDS:1 n=1 Tax=Ambispora leptoticha TaxID=144679 RepID=A0A9N9BGB4_9GLOM|nr:7446_t:CDS:1 [Ambispora leptoticha]